MTTQDFTAKAQAAALPTGGEPRLDPITLMVLAAVVSTAVAWIVEKMLDWLWEHIVKGRTLAARLSLRMLYVRPAVKQVARERGMALTADQRRDLEDAAVRGIVGAARSLTEDEFAAMKAAALGLIREGEKTP